ncbi:MAG: SDR family oxidoreductase [Acidimicrobiales bacterium]
MDLGLTGRRALVTGGSKGLGRAIAAELVAEGADVAVCARHGDELERAADQLRGGGGGGGATGPGGRVLARACDVTDPKQVAGLVAAVAAELGGLDILVNNAGGAHPGNFETLTDADWHGDLDVKLFSQIRCTRAALPHLRDSPAPRVVNVNAVYGRYPDPAFFATTVNRAACLNLTKALAIQLGPDGILVNSVNIGFVATPQWANIRARQAPDLPEEQFFASLAGREVPLGRFGRDDEVSGLVAFLASDRASYITGASIDVAGGMGRYV